MRRRLLIFAASAIGALLLFIVGRSYLHHRTPQEPAITAPRLLSSGKHLGLWWDELPGYLAKKVMPSSAVSNIHPSDYVGPDACRRCHARNYESWSSHPHRWMNALANPGTIHGDFSGREVLSYRGGQASSYSRGGKYFMRLDRAGTHRLYEITQTIGSRFFQYYVGRQIEGPEPPDHAFCTQEHVLPFGYWLAEKEWVPVVHIGPEVPDDKRPDPYSPPDKGTYFADYAGSCNFCHTTFPLADLFGRRTQQMGEYAPVALHWSMRKYLASAHPQMLPEMEKRLSGTTTIQNPMRAWEASEHAVTLGVSCEACHLGCKEHVASAGRIPPKFFPASPCLYVAGETVPDFGRSHDNVNWACGRCHVGSRPRFAAGMSTWNSVEYSDAVLGSCYSKLRCVDCHNPHRALGRTWTLSAGQDDAVCLQCHDRLKATAERTRHTHHPAGSPGSRCLNCHMPRINEGLQQVVRTHMIYSPTRRDMLEANHPNACNLCHTDQPIDWTLRYLKQWYGAAPREEEIAAHYPHRTLPVVLGWLRSANPAVRLVAADALIRRRDPKNLPHLLDALDDPYLVNRQFVYGGLQEWLKVRLGDFGYRFYLSESERRQALAGVRERLLRAVE